MKAKVQRLVKRAFLLLCMVIVLNRYIRDRHDGFAREAPVDFSALSDTAHSATWLPERAIRQSNGTHIDERYRLLRQLSNGGQGSVSLYVDRRANITVVVKTISAVARNRLPSKLLPAFSKFTHNWPSEIAAGMSLGISGVRDESPSVPLHDYFILLNDITSTEPWTWTMVTPFISGGTLVDLARELRQTSGTIEQTDSIYRSSFNGLLTNLRWLHKVGYCHDDVKPMNVFVQTPEHWLLGDLGNARESNHPYHSTRLWQLRNQWSDCKLNDVRRALKSYLFFLRKASHDRAQFDLEFLAADKGWSKLYWDFVGNPEYYSRVEAMSEQPSQVINDGHHHHHHGTRLGNFVRSLKVRQELLCTSLWWKLWLQP